MTSISNLFSNLNDLTKTINDHAKEYKENKEYLNSPSPAINQGEKYKRYQNKIKKNLVKKTKDFTYFNKEAFQNIENNLQLSANGLTAQSNEVIQNNDYSSQQQIISDLQKEYKNTLHEYEKLVAQISGSTTGYLNRVNPNNPYLGKNIVFTTGETAYVTQQGIVKLYPTAGWVAWYTMGKNGCPTGVETPINLPWISNYNTPGATIPSKPPLVTGTPMTSGQSCGNEGVNIFVNKMINNPNITYQGCYADNQQSPLMTFIGGSPPPPSVASLQNGNFTQPQIANNSFQYINSTSTVPGWNFNAVLINNSTAWGYPMPYPSGNQAACIQGMQSFSQGINLLTGANYTLSFSACGRPGYNGANNIQINLLLSGGMFVGIYTFVAPVNNWTNYSFSFGGFVTGNYTLVFQGETLGINNSTAIQNIKLTSSSGGSSGSYTYDQCKEAAIDSGYQYFALQGVNPSTSLGYCAASNNQPGITSLGAAMVPSGQKSLWSSNTSGQTGNTATLTITGALSVLNSGGQGVYSTPNTNAQPSNYLGCYGDGPNRAMPGMGPNNYSQQYNLQQCQQIAQQNGATYFGLQNSTSGTTAQCFLSSNWGQTSEYGKAGNCTQISDGSWSGGGWSNAVYNTSLPQSNYCLILTDDGNMVINRGTSPTDNQGQIWTSNTKAQQANPAFAAANGKYGKNWITQGATLATGDFVGSPNGYVALVMQSDGNLVLYTFTMVSNCQKMQDGKNGGGVGANAIYNIGEVGTQSNLTQVAYIDQNSELHTYPSTNTQYANSYTELKGNNSSGYDIPNAAFGNATVQSCQSTCNNNPQCAGFTFTNNTCFPKTSGMYPNGTKQINQDTNLYIRDKKPISTPMGVPLTTKNTDTITYGNYVNGGQLGNKYGLANATSAQKAQLSQLQTQLNLLSNQLTSYTNAFGQGSQQAEAQSQTNVVGLTDYVHGLKKTNDKIQNIDENGNIENILKDSDIVVLQKNYDYLFWSILAVGSVLVTMNITK